MCLLYLFILGTRSIHKKTNTNQMWKRKIGFCMLRNEWIVLPHLHINRMCDEPYWVGLMYFNTHFLRHNFWMRDKRNSQEKMTTAHTYTLARTTQLSDRCLSLSLSLSVCAFVRVFVHMRECMHMHRHLYVFIEHMYKLHTVKHIDRENRTNESTRYYNGKRRCNEVSFY